MKTKIIKAILLLVSIIGIGQVIAGDLNGFVIQVNPSTVKIGEPTDITIKAVDENGDVVDDYVGDVIITVTDEEGNDLDTNDYVAPNDGTYSFSEEDMGIKTFTKGLIINKAGNFKIKVEDFETEKNGIGDIKVLSNDGGKEKGKVEIISPKEGETVIKDNLSIIANAKKYKNAKYQIFIDNKLNSEGLVDSNGNIQAEIMLNNIKNGKHLVKIKILDINNKVIAESNKVGFKIKKDTEYFKGLEILPSKQVTQGAEITFNAKVTNKVSSVILKINNLGDFLMDRKNIDTFTTNIKTTRTGKFDISIKVKGDFGEKEYKNIDKIVVIEKIAILDVKSERDNNEKKIKISWKFSGQVPMFKIEYGTDKNKLTNQVLVSENKYEIKNINEALPYFIKIIPTDSAGNRIGDESKIIVVEANLKKAATCKIDNIKVKTKVEGKKHYLIWDKVEGAKNYIIYKGDNENNMKEIKTITGTSFEFPFDYNSKKNKYAFYVVKAKCEDGEIKQIDKVKKVKVGPMDWLIAAFIISLMMYGLRLSLNK